MFDAAFLSLFCSPKQSVHLTNLCHRISLLQYGCGSHTLDTSHIHRNTSCNGSVYTIRLPLAHGRRPCERQSRTFPLDRLLVLAIVPVFEVFAVCGLRLHTPKLPELALVSSWCCPNRLSHWFWVRQTGHDRQEFITLYDPFNFTSGRGTTDQVPSLTVRVFQRFQLPCSSGLLVGSRVQHISKRPHFFPPFPSDPPMEHVHPDGSGATMSHALHATYLSSLLDKGHPVPSQDSKPPSVGFGSIFSERGCPE